jgi:hypothetical protein
VEESLLEFDLSPSLRYDLFRAVSRIVHSAGEREHGCTVVMDFNSPPLGISGHYPEKPLDLTREDHLGLATSLATVDGALHVGGDLRMHGFACLLDGRRVPGESRARGARFNSALRFSAEHPDVLIVVVSADRPVSVIRSGIELTAACDWRTPAGAVSTPPRLAEWIEG